MKLQVTGSENRRISNIEPQNVEGWFRFAQSFFKIDKIHPFDIHYSIFAFSEFLFRFDRPIFWPATGLNPESLKHLSINNFLLNYSSIDYLIINI